MTQLFELLISTSPSMAQIYNDAFDDHALSVSWFEDEEEQFTKLCILFDFTPDQTWVENNLFSLADQHGEKHPSFEIKPLENTDWLRKNFEDFPPLHIGSFYIYGSHHEPISSDDIGSKHPLKIDAATAFGTGKHATTSGCIEALDDLYKKNFSPQLALDVGCGTAILAMAIKTLFPQADVIASDNDPEAVRVAHDNCVFNKTTITVIEAQGYDHASINDKTFDLIAANILAKPLIDLAHDAAKHLAKNGFLILSGLLHTQAQEVIEAHEKQNLKLVNQHTHDGWDTLLFSK